MRAQMARMAERIDTLETQLAAAEAKAESASSAASNAVSLANAAAKEPEVKVAWKGAPELEGKGGWSFKPRGRLQYDAGIVNAPGSISDRGLGFASEVRRARLGVEGSSATGVAVTRTASAAETRDAAAKWVENVRARRTRTRRRCRPTPSPCRSPWWAGPMPGNRR